MVPESSGITFAQQKAKTGPRLVEDWHKDATCHNCNEKGRITPNYPNLQEESASDDSKTPTKDKLKKGKVTFTQHNSGQADNNSDEDDSSSSEGHQFCNWGSCTPNTRTVKDLNLKKMVLLDNESTVDLFCNRSFYRKSGKWKNV